MEQKLIVPDNEITPEVLADASMHARLKKLCDMGRFGLRRQAKAAEIELTPELKRPGSHKLFVATLFEKEFGTSPFVDVTVPETSAPQTLAEPETPPSAQPEPAQEAAPMTVPATDPTPESEATAKNKMAPAKKQGGKRSAGKGKAKAAPSKRKAASKPNGKTAPAVPAAAAPSPTPNPIPTPARSVAYDDGDDTPTEGPSPFALPTAPPPMAKLPPPVDTAGIEQKLGELTMHVEHLTEQLNTLQDTFITLSTVTSILLPTIQTGFHRLGKEFGTHVAKDLIKRFDKVEQSIAPMEAEADKTPD